MPILNRTPLSSSDKLDLLAKSAILQAHGDITALSDEFGISRKAVYTARGAARAAFDALVKTQSEPDCIATLDVDVPHLRRSIVALTITAPNSIRSIEALIPLLYPGCKVSYGYIQGVIAEAQKNAADFNRTVPLSAIQSGAVDEMFSQGDPVLAGVDLDSGYLFCLSHEQQRDGKTWAKVLQQAAAQGMMPKHIVKDGAKGIAAGVTTVFEQAQQRDDVFHALYIAAKAVRRVEQRAYYYITQEETAYQAISPTITEDPDDTFGQWLRADNQCDKAIERYEHAERALHLLHATFSCVCRKTGKLMTTEMAQTRLARATLLLRRAAHKECNKAATYLENRLDGLTLATQALHDKLQGCIARYSQQPVELACRFFECRRELAKAGKHKQQRLIQEMLGSYHLLTTQLDETRCEQLMQEVEILLSKRHRASSAIEGFNATLRTYLYARKGVNQPFLELFRAWYNLREKRWGRHKGKSAHELLTGEKVADWLTLLGFPPSKLSH